MWVAPELALRAARFVAAHAADLPALVGALSRRTGIPTVVVAALLLVASLRVVKKTARFLVEVGVAVVLVLIAAQMGWVRF